LKLKKYGIRKDLLHWCKAYLSYRTQRVVLGNNISLWKLVTSGVPQGYVLGPLLFVIYVNDLIDGIKNSCKMYKVINDTKIISIIKTKNDSGALQSDLNLLLELSDK
jgi:ribonuclease P/MRP protein subunit RPP40